MDLCGLGDWWWDEHGGIWVALFVAHLEVLLCKVKKRGEKERKKGRKQKYTGRMQSRWYQIRKTRMCKEWYCEEVKGKPKTSVV